MGVDSVWRGELVLRNPAGRDAGDCSGCSHCPALPFAISLWTGTPRRYWLSPTRSLSHGLLHASYWLAWESHRAVRGAAGGGLWIGCVLPVSPGGFGIVPVQSDRYCAHQPHPVKVDARRYT